MYKNVITVDTKVSPPAYTFTVYDENGNEYITFDTADNMEAWKQANIHLYNDQQDSNGGGE